jgi:hypothetical protein
MYNPIVVCLSPVRKETILLWREAQIYGSKSGLAIAEAVVRGLLLDEVTAIHGCKREWMIKEKDVMAVVGLALHQALLSQ